MSTNASRDGNHVPSLLGVSTTDGTTAIPIAADPVTKALLVETVTQGSSDLTTEIDYNGGTNATYVGTATPGTALSAAGWTIKYYTYDMNNNATSITFANAGSATNIWNNRASYTYS